MERVDAEIRRELGRFRPLADDAHAEPIVAVARAWPRAVGETVARNAWPARIGRDGTLHVSTVSATWAFELARLSDTILEQLGTELGEVAPRALSFAPGRVPETRVESPGAVPAKGSPASAVERVRADRIAAGIDDEELRRLVARAAAASLAKGRPEAPDDRRF